MTSNTGLLTGQSPVPAAAGDTARDIAAGGIVLRAVSLRGRRAYQEDRFLVEHGFALAGSAENLLEGLFAAAAAATAGLAW